MWRWGIGQKVYKPKFLLVFDSMNIQMTNHWRTQHELSGQLEAETDCTREALENILLTPLIFQMKKLRSGKGKKETCLYHLVNNQANGSTDTMTGAWEWLSRL